MFRRSIVELCGFEHVCIMRPEIFLFCEILIGTKSFPNRDLKKQDGYHIIYYNIPFVNEVESMVNDGEQEILAKIRTLLALERNYLAEERTTLAEFRTGLAMTVIGPTASTAIAYFFSNLPITEVILYDVINFTAFSILTLVGIWISIQSRSKLRTIRNKKQVIKSRETSLIKQSKTVYDLLCECIDLNEKSKHTKQKMRK